jgi:hypothetical protein
LYVSGVDDEARVARLRVIGKRFQFGAFEERLVLGLGYPVANRAREQDAADDRACVDCDVGHLPDAFDDDLEVGSDVARELEIIPTRSEHARRDGSARDA